MNYQSLFSGKNKKEYIINMSSAPFAHRVVKVKNYLAARGIQLYIRNNNQKTGWEENGDCKD